MRVVVDGALCVGNGICEALAPEVFETTGDGQVRLLTDTVPEDYQGDVDDAISSCPMQALSLAADTTPEEEQS